MDHDKRMEATGGVLGGVLVGAAARAVSGLRGLFKGSEAPGEEPGGKVGDEQGEGENKGGDAEETPEAKRARLKQKLEENQKSAREREEANDRARDAQNKEDGALKNQRGQDAERQSLDDAMNNPDRDPNKPVLDSEGAIRNDNNIPLDENGNQPKLPDHSYTKNDGTQSFTEVKNETSTDASAVKEKFETVSQSSKYPNQEYNLEMWDGGKFSDPAYSTGSDGTLQYNGQQVQVGGKPINVVTKPFPR